MKDENKVIPIFLLLVFCFLFTTGKCQQFIIVSGNTITIGDSLTDSRVKLEKFILTDSTAKANKLIQFYEAAFTKKARAAANVDKFNTFATTLNGALVDHTGMTYQQIKAQDIKAQLDGNYIVRFNNNDRSAMISTDSITIQGVGLRILTIRSAQSLTINDVQGSTDIPLNQDDQGIWRGRFNNRDVLMIKD